MAMTRIAGGTGQFFPAPPHNNETGDLVATIASGKWVGRAWMFKSSAGREKMNDYRVRARE